MASVQEMLARHRAKRGDYQERRGAGNIYPVDPEAVKRLKTILAEQDQEEDRRMAKSQALAERQEHIQKILQRAKSKPEEDSVTELTQEQMQEIHGRCVAGENIKDVAREYSASWQWVTSNFHKHGLDPIKEARAKLGAGGNGDNQPSPTPKAPTPAKGDQADQVEATGEQAQETAVTQSTALAQQSTAVLELSQLARLVEAGATICGSIKIEIEVTL